MTKLKNTMSKFSTLKLKSYRQREGLCGPTVLKMVLEYFGVKKSEDTLAKLTETTPSSGMDIYKAKVALEKLGFKVIIKDFSTFEDIQNYLKQEIPVIIDWFSTDEGHYSVAVGLDDKNIYLQDTELGGLRTIPLLTFKRIWFDFRGEFIKSKDDIIIRRIIVVQPI